jgi:hypothetical protein
MVYCNEYQLCFNSSPASQPQPAHKQMPYVQLVRLSMGLQPAVEEPQDGETLQ